MIPKNHTNEGIQINKKISSKKAVKTNKVLSAVDIFSGAGGMSVGANMVGINVVVAVEYDKHAIASFEANHPDTLMIPEDIRKVTLGDDYKNPFILFGGPPCQGFSTSNTKTRNSENTNN